MMNCVNGSGTWAGTGAIGYADADQAVSPNTQAIAYNGEMPHRINIRNGLYDNFWSIQHLYENPAAPEYAATHGLVQEMMTFAANPNNIPSCKAPYWAAYGEMQNMKPDDFSYPFKVTAPNPQNP
jgi:hypothetical protein